MRIIDTFPYFNEKELLELRIKLLHDYVDKFIIVDADHTHKGDPKPFTCKDTLKDLGLLSDKIEVVELNLPSYNENPNAWERERLQRNEAAKYIEDDDVFIVSDCDEIIDPNFIHQYTIAAKQYYDSIVRIPLIYLMSRADLRVYYDDGRSLCWNTPFLCLKHHLQTYTLSEIRESHAKNKFNLSYKDIYLLNSKGTIDDAGWHFSWMGDINRIKTKCNSFLHWDEVSPPDSFTPKENSRDLFNREDHNLKKYPIELLPQKIFELENVRRFLFQES